MKYYANVSFKCSVLGRSVSDASATLLLNLDQLGLAEMYDFSIDLRCFEINHPEQGAVAPAPTKEVV